MTLGDGKQPVVGVTGLPCAGKSHVAELLASGRVTGRPGLAVHADRLGHEVLRRPEVVAAIVGRFGSGVADDGRIDRARVAEIVFAAPAKLAWLESILHPIINAEAKEIIDAAGRRKLIALEAALLFEAGMERLCDLVLVVEASRSVRLARAAARGWDERELDRREKRLSPLFEKARLAAYPVGIAIIDNTENDTQDGGLERKLAEALSVVAEGKDKP